MVTCRFLETLTLASLIAPVPEDEFREIYWEKAPLVVHRHDPDYYGDLFTVEDFDEAIARSPDHIKISDAAKAGRGGTTTKEATAHGLESALAGLKDGSTLVLEQLQLHDPKLGLLCRLLQQQLSHRFDSVLFLTPPNGKSSLPHWDNTDGFILQVWGTKRWKIEKERRLFPVRPDRMGDDERAFRGETISFTADQGDFIYIPRGFMHVAECGPEPSLHISLGLVPVVLEEFLHAMIRVAVRDDERLRVALPLGFTHGEEDQVLNLAIGALKQVAREDFARRVLARVSDERVTRAQLDISGQIAGFFRPISLNVDDIVGPRLGTIFRLHAVPDGVRLNVGTRSIVFPKVFQDALNFALHTPRFAVRDIKGDIQDEERIAFTQRLIDEGLLVRKTGVRA